MVSSVCSPGWSRTTALMSKALELFVTGSPLLCSFKTSCWIVAQLAPSRCQLPCVGINRDTYLCHWILQHLHCSWTGNTTVLWWDFIYNLNYSIHSTSTTTPFPLQWEVSSYWVNANLTCFYFRSWRMEYVYAYIYIHIYICVCVFHIYMYIYMFQIISLFAQSNNMDTKTWLPISLLC